MPRTRARVLLVLSALALTIGLPLACSDSGHARRAGGDGTFNNLVPPATGPCKIGETRGCSVTIGVHDGVLSCFEGTQTCKTGTWESCTDGNIQSYKQPSWVKPGPATGPSFLALSTAGPCASNPCDPNCRMWNEVPDAPWGPAMDGSVGIPKVPDGGVPFNWTQGSYESFPAGTMQNMPCTEAADCEIGTHCVGPSDGACAHSQCDTGIGLTSGCNQCVTDICTAMPQCCTTPTPACAHDPCVTGAGLNVACDPCVAAICLTNPSCCSGTWDGTCVSAIATTCGALGKSCKCRGGQTASADGKSCYELHTKTTTFAKAELACEAIGSSYHLAEIQSSTENDLVKNLVGSKGKTWIGANDKATEGTWLYNDGTAVTYTNWNSGEPNNLFNQDCAAMYAKSGGFFGFLSGGTWGAWDDDTCSNLRNYACEGGPSVLAGPTTTNPNGIWDQSCVNAVDSLCGATCQMDPTSGQQLTEGVCLPWFPEEKDPGCTSWDLTLAPTCGGTIPVCNHGNIWAPAGIDIAVYAPGTYAATPLTPPAAPNEKTNVTATPKQVCTTTDQIPPGWCVDVPCSPNSNDELLVNPPGATHNAAECRGDNNWGIFRGGACGAPICSANASVSSQRALNLFIMMDRSGQMDTNPPKLLWWAATNAIKAFVADPESANIHVALGFFPTPPAVASPPPGYTPPVSGCSAQTSSTTTGGFFGFFGTTTTTAAPCVSAACAVPEVEGTLSYDLAPTDQTEASIISVIGQTTPDSSGSSTNSPLFPALGGALSWAEEGKVAKPDQEWDVVLVTAAAPSSGCDTSTTDIAGLAAAARAAPFNVKTYVVGLENSSGTPVNQTLVNAIASAGGTTPIWVSATDPNTTQTVVNGLQTIAGQAVQCNVTLPNQGKFDPTQASVSFVPSTPPAGFVSACRADELEYGGHCYKTEHNGSSTSGFWGTTTKNVDWMTARGECRSVGDGWDLVKIETAAENTWLASTFVPSMKLAMPAWIGGNERVSLGKWVWPDSVQFWQGANGGTAFPAGSYADWASGYPVKQPTGFLAPSCSAGWGCVKMQSNGTWVDTCCGDNATAICEGPKITGSASPCDAGQVYGPDGKGGYACYVLNTTDLTWGSARSACQARGTGWDLAEARDATVNTFIASKVYAANDVWIGVYQNPDQSWSRVDGTQIWSTPVPACRSGETARLGEDGTTHCYVTKSTGQTWSDMQKGGRTYSCGFATCSVPPGCEDLGSGFDLVRIDSASENTFVQTLAGGQSVWTGGNERANPGTWRWPDNATFWIDAAGCY